MLKLAKENLWTWPVTALKPDDEGGLTEIRFRARFRLVPAAEREALRAEPDGIRKVLKRAVVEVLDVVDDETGLPLTMKETPGLLDTLLGIAWVENGLIQSYADALSGTPPRAAAGN
jgi:hypothetical protein